MMTRRKHPLVPLGLFRNRSFATINLSTRLIYGALYANFGFQALFLQGTLGYSPLGAALIGLPSGLLLTTLSARIGGLAGRIGVRPFLIVGPLVMALGMLWWLTVPSTSAPWTASLGDLATLVPPIDALTGPLPAGLIFGLGISTLVAPLTTALMSSAPVRQAGVASAINNALSRVGQPLVAATVFIVVSGTFYGSLAGAIPGADPGSPELRQEYEPLNPPPADTPPDIVTAAKAASTDAYHVAVLVCAVLLVSGAVVNAIGLREPSRARGQPAPDAAPPGSAAG
jgi:predicted MFS family arabinose efflux permease